MKQSQILSSGITIRQNFKDSVRFVFFDTGDEGWKYATHGGTAFVVNYQEKVYALTCHHVFQDFEYHQLAVTDEKIGKKGTKIAGIKGICRPSSPKDGAIGTDITELCLVEFIDEVDPTFFKDTAYIVNSNTVISSQKGHRLLVAGSLKDKSEIVTDIHAGFCQLEFLDNGAWPHDPLLRHGIAEFNNPEFSAITGISGSPVYDATANALCGMVVRGNMSGNRCQIYYIDIFDIIKFLEAAYVGRKNTYYHKYIKQIE